MVSGEWYSDTTHSPWDGQRMILLYHGIVASFHPAERWCAGQALPLPCFERQLDWLLQHRRIVPLSDYLEGLGRGKRALRNIVALTFDDGLASTFQHVFPLLRERAVPATFFIASAHLKHGSLLWFCYLNALCF